MSSVLDRFQLDGKRALITGASRRLGREMALALAEAGADSAISGRDRDCLESTAEGLAEVGAKAWTFQADTRDSDETIRLCESVHSESTRSEIASGSRLASAMSCSRVGRGSLTAWI